MSRRSILVVQAAAAVVVCGWALGRQERPAPPKEPPDVTAKAKAELMAADRAFAKATAEKGLAGWMSFMAGAADPPKK